MKTRTLWVGLIVITLISFSVLLFFGKEIYRLKPPIPEKVVSEGGEVLFTMQQIRDGQNVWQSIGGQQIGSVWGHGAYVAPDWSADWLHREAGFILDEWSSAEFGVPFDRLEKEKQVMLEVRLQKALRANTYNESTGILTISGERARAVKSISSYYAGLFMNNPSLEKERTAYSIPANTIKDNDRMAAMNAFFFWAAWACVTERPGSTHTYTSNWPPDPAIGNIPSAGIVLWTGFSVIMLLVGIGLLAYYNARNRSDVLDSSLLPQNDPLGGLHPTPSMKAVLKYYWVVVGLILLQILTGVITAHYGVEGNQFYGLSLASIMPYSISRTWHIQLALFWIATAWLAAGLYIAPAVSGHEPRFQKAGVNFLFFALLVIVVGSMAGEWMGVMQKLGLVKNFWFGHQGYEYVDLGRFWQAFLFIGFIIWLFLMFRALWPAITKRSESRELLILFSIATVAIGAFYGAGLMWGRQTHLSIAEYWRWWVVHLWVEGFFEVFATVIAAFLFVRMGLLNIRYATAGVLFATIVYLAGGVLGTFHHLYFAGTPTAVIALGATFSALEVVPLVFMGFEAYHNLQLSKATAWVKAYKWPIYFIISVSFWNLVGAGLFGFLINPPIALYYMQGLNTTPLHGHAALFGVFGMLAIGLMLFVLKGLTIKYEWKTKMLSIAFWTMNGGLMLMLLLSLLPVGVLQTVASIKVGMWYARSIEFMQEDHMQVFRWLRLVGDTVFAVGAVALALFVIGLKTGWSIDTTRKLYND
ncbi:MAG: nitric-oxide reductase large subunit [Bacteroidales bacterium]|nr:nitric-oxide reductase large subunit [Bacteroidales bacterium]HPM18786.1 nitric-oxide reductase large subunit [Bacteroidales bacterium]